MRPPQVDDKTMYQGLMEVLRAKGYQGASFTDFAGATGLAKASLYHRFPEGKQQIAKMVLQLAQEWTDKHVFQVLSNTLQDPQDRLQKALDNIKVLYQGGEKICILRSLSVEPALALFQEQIAQNMEHWIGGFSRLGRDMGFSDEEAKQKATQSLIQVQGSLVVAKGTANLQIFEEGLQNIRAMYKQG